MWGVIVFMIIQNLHKNKLILGFYQHQEHEVSNMQLIVYWKNILFITRQQVHL